MRFAWTIALLAAACERSPGTPPDGLDLGVYSADAGLRGDSGTTPGRGRLRVAVTDDETGQPLPARVIFTAVPPTPAIRFDHNAAGQSVNGEYGTGVAFSVIGAPEGVLLATGDGTWSVPPGTYDLFITHGPEWEADTRRVTIDSTLDQTIVSSLRHSVDTRGWTAADLHIHTARSFDSRIQLDVRVVTEVAVGIELLVSTDHNVASDLQPEIETLGYGRLARAIVGNEFNFAQGHGGAYPVPYDPRAIDGGVTALGLNWEIVRSIDGTTIFPMMHALATHPAVTVNHPRLPPDLGYFINLKQFGTSGWAPPLALPDAGLFDGLELMNGYQQNPMELQVLLRDWFFLLSSGTRVTALGSSDTHRLRDVKAGFPRTWFRLPSDDPTKILDSDLADAVKRQRAVASNGPFVRLTVDGAEVGDQVSSTTGEVVIDALADAPGWIDVDNVRLYVNGALAREFPVTPGLRPLFHGRWKQKVPAGDAWIVLQAGGAKPLPVALIGEHESGTVTPFAITNPVFVDGDGDGLWQPHIPSPDPGPLGPVDWPLPPWQQRIPEHPVPIDCEPPLWMDPWLWVSGQR